MAKDGGKKGDVDVEVDYHGCTIEQMRHELERHLHAWRGIKKVRVIHGQGTALKPELERWCREKGIPCLPEPNNPGSTRLYPSERVLPASTLTNTLASHGLQLTPEQAALLYDPETLKQAREEEKRQRQEAERERRETAAKRQREESLWQAEMARLDKIEQRRSGSKPGNFEKPMAPRIVPPSVMRFQEGYWRAEIVRVNETEEERLLREKRTGLEKLAPPLTPVKKSEAKAPNPEIRAPKRDEQADQALFEAALEQLDRPDRDS